MADFSISALVRAIDGVSKPMGKMSRSLSLFGDKATSVGRKMSTSLTLPIAAFGALTAKTGIDFETSMNRVQATLNLTEQEMEAVKAAAREMGATTQFTAGQAGEALNFLAMAGLDADSAIKALPGSLELAAAGELELGEAADIATNVLSQMKLEVSDLSKVNDVLAKGASSSNTDVRQLAQAFVKVGSISKTAGVSLEETTTILGVMANNGFRAEEAGTALRNGILRLVGPANDAQEALVKLGFKSSDIVDSNGQLISLTGTLNKLREAGAKLPDLQKIFGTRAAAQFAAILGTTEQQVGKLNAKILDFEGTAGRMATTKMQGLPGIMKLLASTFEAFQLKILNSGLREMIMDIVGGLISFLRWLNNLSPAILKWGTIMVGLVGVLGPVLFSLGLLSKALAFFGITIAAISSPVLLAIGAMAALGAAVYAIYDNWGAISGFFSGVWNNIKTAFVDGWNFIKPFVDKIIKVGEVITSPIRAMRGALGALVGKAAGVLGLDSAQATTASRPRSGLAVQNQSQSKAEVAVKFENLPRNTDIESRASGKGLDFQLDTGSQLAASPL